MIEMSDFESVSGKILQEEKMHYKYPKVLNLGHKEIADIFLDEIIFQEKIDGANFQFQIYKGELIFGSRNQHIANPESSGFIAVAPVRDAYEKNPDAFSPLFLYIGESMQPHTLKYTNIPDFVGFDIMIKTTGDFVTPEKAKKLFEAMGLPFINTLGRKHGNQVTEELLEQLINLPSAYGSANLEGVVIKNYRRVNKYGRPLWGKVVRDDFRESNKSTFKTLGISSDDEFVIVETFATEARIRKRILAMVNDGGQELSMKLMSSGLFDEVARDIFAEEYKNISHLAKRIVFAKFRSLVAKKCAITLKKVIQEQAFVGKDETEHL